MLYSYNFPPCEMSDEGVCKMAISYNKLWKLLIDNKMSKKDLRVATETSQYTITKLGRNEPVSLDYGRKKKICGNATIIGQIKE